VPGTVTIESGVPPSPRHRFVAVTTPEPPLAARGSATQVDPRLTAALAGRYRIERELGRGGMSTVFLARDLRHDRDVAVKVMHPELALGRERFLREIGVAASLSHPHIVGLHDSGDADGLLYYVMPYIAGDTLRGRLDAGPPFAIDEIARLCRQIADALGSAHQRGIVHRDVKPENILITSDGHALVTDFGIAVAMQVARDERLTRTGVAVGTPAYMSPEQMYAGDADARSDVWALGCILFEMLTGRMIGRSAASYTGEGGQDRMAADIRRMRPDTPDYMVAVVQRALAPDADARFASAREMAQALASQVPSRETGIRAQPRRRTLVIAGVAALAILAAITARIGVGTGSEPARAPRDPAVLALYQQGLREFDRRTPDGAVHALQSFRAALERDSTFAAAWVGLSNTYTRTIIRRWIFSGAAQDSILRLAVAAVHRAMAHDSSDSRVWVARAEVSRLVDPTDMGPALRAARRAVSLDSSSGHAWYILGLSLADSGDLTAGVDAWRQGARRSPSYNQGLAFLSLGHFWRKQYDSAAFWADSAIAVDPNYHLARHTLGVIEIERGNFARAIAAMDAARRLTAETEIPAALAGRAIAEAGGGDGARARRTLRVADSLARTYEPPSLHIAVYLAAAYAALGDKSRAVAWLERYPLPRDRHFQLHVQCDPGFAPLARESGFVRIMGTSDRVSGC
jgi:serine/threonine protein kinase/Tfp pilus assembly protein PilF